MGSFESILYSPLLRNISYCHYFCGWEIQLIGFYLLYCFSCCQYLDYQEWNIFWSFWAGCTFFISIKISYPQGLSHLAHFLNQSIHTFFYIIMKVKGISNMVLTEFILCSQIKYDNMPEILEHIVQVMTFYCFDILHSYNITKIIWTFFYFT